MSTTLSRTDERLRQVFKIFNRFMLLMFRLGLGNWGNSPKTSQVMVLIQRGRKTGLLRRTPVNFARVDGEIYVTAAFGQAAHWYRNILADPNVEMWLPNAWYAGVAEEVTVDDPRRSELMRTVLLASGFAAPLFAGMNPKSASDEALAELTAPYRLIRIRPTEARTGPGGPGDLAWVWPAAVFALLALLMRARLKVRKTSHVSISSRRSRSGLTAMEQELD